MRNIAMLLVAIIMLNMYTCETFEFIQAPSLFHLKTPHVVSHEAHLYDVDYVLINICEAYDPVIHGGQISSYAQKSFKVLHRECNVTFTQDILLQLDALAEWKPREPEESNSTFHRVKRWIMEFFTICVVLLVISAVAYVMNEYFNPDSDHNQIKAIKEREIKRDSEIANIKAALNSTKGVIETQNELLKHLTDLSEEHKTRIEEISELIPTVSWTSVQLYGKMQKLSKNIKLIKQFSENDELATRDFAELIHNKNLRNIDPSQTELLEITKKDQDTYNFRFNVMPPADDTLVYRIKNFTVHENFDTVTPTLKTYVGPKYMIYNSKLNCSKGLEIEEGQHIYGSCDTKDYMDPQLLQFTQRNVTRAQRKIEPQVFKTKKNSFIYCLYHNVTIENFEQLCPTHVFVLPIETSFQVGNYTHTGINYKIISKDAPETISGIKFKHVKATPEHGVSINLINKLAERKDDLDRALDNIGVHNGSIVLPISWIFEISWTNWLTIGSITLTILSLLWHCCFNMRNSDHVTVVQPNNPASEMVLMHELLEKENASTSNRTRSMFSNKQNNAF